MEPGRVALRLLMAELGRAQRALSRGAIDDALRAVHAALAIDPHNVQALQWLQELEQRAKVGAEPFAPVGRVAAPRATVGATRVRAHGWSAFEQRVRERRTSRCLEIARAALARDDVAAAREALDELLVLAPDDPEVATLRLALPSAPTTPSSILAPPPSDARFEPFHEAAPARDRDFRRQQAAAATTAQASRPKWPPVAQLPRHDLSETPRVESPPIRTPISTTSASSPGGRYAAVGLVAATFVMGALLAIGYQTIRRDEITIASPTAELEATHGDGAFAVAEDASSAAGELTAAAEPTLAPTGEEGVETALEPAEEQDTVEQDAVEQDADVPVITTGAEPVQVATAGLTDLRERGTAVIRERRLPDSEREPPAPRPDVPQANSSTSTLPSAVLTSIAKPDAPPPAVEPETPLEAPKAAAVSSSPTASSPAPPTEAPAMTPTAAAPPVRPHPAEASEAAVRAVLQEYLAAYNSLDASAARAVWPGVNRSALERAFGQLESQTLRFDRCRVSVDDSAGSATCSGQAIWVPRIGARDAKRERRTWHFELAQNEGEWIITRAEAKR